MSGVLLRYRTITVNHARKEFFSYLTLIQGTVCSTDFCGLWQKVIITVEIKLT